VSSLICQICKVDKIETHPNASKLDLVIIKGWQCIVGKGNHKEGELVIYCPPDSIIPNNLIEKYNLEFLKKNGRVGRIKLRGCLSEGLILDLTCLPIDYKSHLKEGSDVASILNITKYEVPEPSYNACSSNKTISKRKKNSQFSEYTDIDNIKNYKNIFTEDDTIVISEKIHGTNARYGYLEIEYRGFLGCFKKLYHKYITKKTHEFCYGSHHMQKDFWNRNKGYYEGDVYYQIAKRYNLDRTIPQDYIIYGEIIGKGIQDLTYGLDEIDVKFFDVKYKGKYLSYNKFIEFCLYRNLPVVPTLYIGQFKDNLITEHTSGQSKLCPSQIREGCVIKTIEETTNSRIGRKILKSINVDYLLRKKGTEYK